LNLEDKGLHRFVGARFQLQAFNCVPEDTASASRLFARDVN